MPTFHLPYIAKGVNQKKVTKIKENIFAELIPYTGHMLKEINLHDGLADFGNRSLVATLKITETDARKKAR